MHNGRPDRKGAMPLADEETAASARDGTPIVLRLVRPDDEPLLHDLFAHMSAEDIRLRFFAPMRALSHSLADRLVHLDPARQVALVALYDGATLGIARYSTPPDTREAEFAVAVRSDWKGRGVGTLLINQLIEIAREAGIAELTGTVLHENRPMLDLCRALGFTLHAHPSDATAVLARKSLG